MQPEETLKDEARPVRALEPEPSPGAIASEPRPPRTLDVIGARNWFFLASLVIIIPGIISMASQGFLLGIDFQGGTEFQIRFTQSPSLGAVQTAVTAQGVSGVVQQTGAGSFLIRTGALDPSHQAQFETALTNKLGPIDQGHTQVADVGPTIAAEIVQKAIIAIVSASALILLYLAFRFRRVQGGFRSGVQFGGSALLALLHDVFLLTGIFSILGKGIPFLGWHGNQLGQVDSLFLTAVLTVIGFSVHDTIVIFDRIRENMIVAQRLSFEQVVNLSIMQSAARSIITSFTVVLVLLSLFFFGGDTLRGFVLALLIGIVSGTYSSIFNASPLLVVWRRLQPVR
ncbi:MAG TPA: protein translocase subunit SecF [Candidatus Dormibacteraeota bacterium]|nr:protein translocase subunit SecF [Candidatus Dormibacteraeota bacterium]